MNDVVSTDPQKTEPTRKGVWQLRLIILVSVVPLAFAYTAFFAGWTPQSKINNGTLLTPPKDLRPLVESLNDKPDWSENVWRLLIPITESCADDCQNHLYITRQVHIRLAQKAERVERVAVNLGGEQGRAIIDGLAEEHPKLKSFSLTQSQWYLWLDASNAPRLTDQHFYVLVDPQGYAMMYYDENQNGNQLLKDIKKILRHTPDS